MSNIVVNGFFTLAGILLGILGTVYVQFVLRKEKFKEILYREQLAAYKEIAERMWDVSNGFYRFSEDAEQMKELHEDTERLTAAIDKNILCISSVVYKRVSMFRDDTTKAMMEYITSPGIQDLVKGGVQANRLTSNGKHFLVAFNTIRNELCIDALSEDILKTINFGKNFFRKMNGKDNSGNITANDT